MEARPRRPPIRSWLYVPGDRPDRIANALSLAADAVIIDLEDAVSGEHKEAARRNAVAAIDRHRGATRPLLFVRVNAYGDSRSREDIAAVVRPGLAGVRLPKCEEAPDVTEAARLIATAERSMDLPEGSVAIVCGIESAKGLANATGIATASTSVLALAFGAADFARDLGLAPGPDGIETLYARSQLVVASRVAEVRAPIESVQTDISDLDLLARTTRAARALGFFGRSVIHPSQIEVVNNVFTPDQREIARARQIVDAAEGADAGGHGAQRLPTGEFVDAAIVRRAHDTLLLSRELSGVRQ